jgi:MoaA/NifB/PqqE/SkfB family radical SAM enzyme
MKPHELAYFASYGFRTLVLRQRKPIIAGMPLTDVCNLRCKHCVVANAGRGPYPFSKIDATLHNFYDMGVRIMYMQGGEIMTWKDGGKDLNDVIRRAHEIGFFKVAVVTNGTLGIDSEADLMWVSIDGSEQVHDTIRGKGTFAAVMHNLETTTHRRVSLNMTINRLNAGEVEAVANIAKEMPTVRGISFNFHTPYPGVEDLCLPLNERALVIDRIRALKRKGLPVLNTDGGLQAMKNNRWRRPVPIIHLMERDRIYECCFGREHPGVCEKCGYGVIAELSQVLSWNIPTILHSLSLFS